ncbi:MAG TPA: FAD:protein FMN transferase [Polyangiaceae bacterium]
MGTRVQVITYTTPALDEAATRAVVERAYAEMRVLEERMSEWRDDSEVSRINQRAGKAVVVSKDTFDVIKKGMWAGWISHGTFDITFGPLGDLWKFGDAAEADPRPPSRAQVEARKALVDFRQVRLDNVTHGVTIPKGNKLGLGGIAKGFIVDRAAEVLRKGGLTSFLVQAGGDLYGAGKKPDGSLWVSGIQDPRGKTGSFFATLELTDHAFSTAGDYARAFIKDGKRYHHILDPRTGYPADACRSVTIWAKDALTADAVDDGVFILGPERGMEIVEALPDVGAVIVDKHNKVWISKRLTGRVRILHTPTDGL